MAEIGVAGRIGVTTPLELVDHEAAGNDPQTAPERRGVLASYGDVNGRRTDDASKMKFVARDVLLLVLGAAGMWGMQIATQWRTQSAIDNLATKFDGYVQKQVETNGEMQRQIDEWRVETKLNRERDSDRQREIAEIKGMLTGLGLLKEPKK